MVLCFAVAGGVKKQFLHRDNRCVFSHNVMQMSFTDAMGSLCLWRRM